MKDDLGQRIKDNYENRTRVSLPRRTYTVIRLDGKAFHTFTRGFKRPYDTDLMDLMDKTAIALAEQIQGVKFGFVQSDEISLVLTDFDSLQTDAWFDGNIQKMVSVSASIATAAFNQEMVNLHISKVQSGIAGQSPLFDKNGNKKRALFDSRVFTVPDLNEVVNYLIWRQQDATRNSIQMGAQALYSQKQLNGKNTSELQELMFQKGINWNDYPSGFKRGRVVVKESRTIEAKNRKTGDIELAQRNFWEVSGETPIFSKNKGFILDRVPKIEVV